MLWPPLWRRHLSCAALEGQRSCVAAALTVALPPLLYLVAHRHVIAQSQHLWGLLLVASAPLVLLTVLQVWRFPNLDQSCLQQLRRGKPTV